MNNFYKDVSYISLIYKWEFYNTHRIIIKDKLICPEQKC